MALNAALASLCPANTATHASCDSTDVFHGSLFPVQCRGDLQLVLRSGGVVHCHKGFMKARCPDLPIVDCNGVVQVDDDASVVLPLLHWIYCETLGGESSSKLGVGREILLLAKSWGLRDFSVLRDRLIGSWRTERRSGTLAQDLVRAYDADALGSGVSFKVAESSDHSTVETLSGGWTELVRNRSSYFHSMLNGVWAESSGNVTIQWPRPKLAKLLRFLHGHPFVDGSSDLMDAVECGSFFGVPSLVAHANDWIASNLKVANAPTLWCFVETERRLRLHDVEGQMDTADADDACFDFHIRRFQDLARDPDDGDGSWVPLHDLSYSLMHRLLASGLVDMPRDALTEVVERFVEAKFGHKTQEVLQELRPPAVLFNRENRSLLMGAQEASIRTIL